MDAVGSRMHSPLLSRAADSIAAEATLRVGWPHLTRRYSGRLASPRASRRYDSETDAGYRRS
jgi:hypothetical protein